MGTAINHPVPDRIKPSFVIFDIRALWRSALSARMPGCQNYKWRQRVRRPLLSVDVSLCVSATLMLNVSETKRFRGSCPIWTL